MASNWVSVINFTRGVLHTFAAREGVIPVADSAMLAGEDGVTRQLVSRQALERDGLTHIEAGTHHHAVAEGLRVGALLQLVG